MGQPAYAAVAVALIFIVLIGSVVGYKLYRRWQWRKIRRQQEAADEAAAADAFNNNRSTTNISAMHFPIRSVSPGPSVMGSLYGEAYPRESIGGRVSMSKASLYSVPAPAYYNGSSASEYAVSRPRRSSSQGLLRVASPVSSPAGYVSQEPSMPGSPVSQSAVGVDGAAAVTAPSSEVADGLTHQRALSSASSTMTLRRQYAASTYRTGAYGGGVSPGPYRGAPSPGPYRGASSPGPYHVRRDSYLPHLPENRDQVQIVPPTPLGFGLGGLAQAVDQKTLAFSTTSGIGNFDEDFSQGLMWVAQSPAEAEEALAVAAKVKNFSEEERQRYLAQGPSTSQPGSQSRSGLTPAMRGAIHNMLYNTGSQPGSSGAQTPDAPGSRPRSPSHAAQWDGTGSSSDIGPSVSQRGANVAHPLEQAPAMPAIGALPALHHDERSPLSGLMNEQHDLSIADLSTNTVSDSPILQAFQHPSHAHRQAIAVAAANGGHTPQDSVNSNQSGTSGTPGLMSSSDSRSRTSSRTGPPSLAHAQQQQQHQQQHWSAAANGKPAIAEHSPPPQLATPPTEKRTSRGWFSMPSWRQSTGDASAA